jgi:hypothetical protein
MKTIAIVSQKGGAGKTTLAIHLAVAAENAGYSTALLDMDPQGTAEAWAEWRNAETPAIVAAKATTLTRKLEQAATAGAGIVIIDTPPLAEAESREAARSADIVLIPCRPRAFDLHAVQTTADLVKFAGKPAFVIFNAAPRAAKLFILKLLPSSKRWVLEWHRLHFQNVLLSIIVPELAKPPRRPSQTAKRRGRLTNFGSGFVNRSVCRHSIEPTHQHVSA